MRRDRVAQPRSHADVVLRHARDQDLLSLQGSLPDERLAKGEAAGEVLALGVRVRTHERQAGFFCVLDGVERSDACVQKLRDGLDHALRQLLHVLLAEYDIIDTGDRALQPALLRLLSAAGPQRCGHSLKGGPQCILFRSGCNVLGIVAVGHGHGHGRGLACGFA